MRPLGVKVGLMLIYREKELIVSKGKLYLDDWNLVSVLVNFEKNAILLHINGESSETTNYKNKFVEGLHTLTLGNGS